jgi:hypothetical protein
VVQYTEEQIRRVEESIRIRREAEPVELVRAVLPIQWTLLNFLYVLCVDR